MRQTAIQLAEVLAQLVGALAGTAGGATFNHAEIARYWQQRLAAGPDRDAVTRLRSLLAIEAADPHLDRQLRKPADLLRQRAGRTAPAALGELTGPPVYGRRPSWMATFRV